MLPHTDKIPVKIPADFLVESEKLILKLLWKNKQPRIAKTKRKASTNFLNLILGSSFLGLISEAQAKQR
jgi:hypothetical protein